MVVVIESQLEQSESRRERSKLSEAKEISNEITLYVTQCYVGYQIGQNLCKCIQKSKGCVISKKPYLTFLE